jgi:hypothetical protein
MKAIKQAFVVPVVIWIAAGLAGLAALFYHPHAKAPPAPDLAALHQAQTDRDKALQDEAAAKTNYDNAIKDLNAKFTSQVSYSQQMGYGSANAFRRVPVAQQGPEYVLGLSLLDRANNGLAKALGDLPDAQRQEILGIVDGVLSKAQDQVAAANKALADKDAQLVQTTSERDVLKGQLPGLKSTLDAKDAAAKIASQLVDQDTAKVVEYAKAKEQTQGFLAQAEAKARFFLKVLVGIAVGWFLLVFILPTVGTAIGPLAEKILHEISGHILSPLTHLKQKATIAAQKLSK